MKLEIHYADDWAALYKDGKLVDRSVGDSYLAEEQALDMLGVKLVHDDSFLRGQNQRSGVATTLEEVEEYRIWRERARAEAQRLRGEAEVLLERAKELEQ